MRNHLPVPGSYEAFKLQYPGDTRRAFQEYRKSLGASYFDESGEFHPDQKTSTGTDLLGLFGLVFGGIGMVVLWFLAVAVFLAIITSLIAGPILIGQSQYGIVGALAATIGTFVVLIYTPFGKAIMGVARSALGPWSRL